MPSASGSINRSTREKRSLARSNAAPRPVPRLSVSAVKSGCAASFFSVALIALSGLPCIASTAWVVASRTRVTASAADSPSTTNSSGVAPIVACGPAPCRAQSSSFTGPEGNGLVIGVIH